MQTRLALPDRATLLSPPVLLAAGLIAGLLWVFGPTGGQLLSRWTHDPQYSHGYLVPVFAVFLLWWRREQLTAGTFRPSEWGLCLLIAGLAVRFLGTYLFLDWLQALALLPCAAGLCVLLGGWAALRWAWQAIAFLVFMVPMPHRLEGMLAHPLRRIGTIAGTYALQTIGIAAFSEGYVIRMGNIPLGVEEACSGLSMLVVFFALSTAVAILIQRPWVDKVILFASAAPIAVIANVARITVTGICHKVAGPDLANLVFHDVAGWGMMIFALFLLWVEFRVISWVLVPREPRATTTPVLPAGKSSGRRKERATVPPFVQPKSRTRR